MPAVSLNAVRPVRFSGHESFACRYAWLPKALQAVIARPAVFSDEDAAMVELGVGKNMVRSIRFWAEAGGMLEPAEVGLRPTTLGKAIFLGDGFDCFMEDVTTLWLIHWKISTAESPLLAWDFLLNRWQDSEFSESRILAALKKELSASERNASDVTLRQHLSIFFHTYLPTRVRRGEIDEDNLDCPLTELELLIKVGERADREDGGRRESIFAFRREDKPTMSHGLFAFCVNDFWNRRYPNEKTLPARAVALGHGSPGQVFKIPEQEIYQRLTELNLITSGRIQYTESEALPQLSRTARIQDTALLNRAYG
jgi:hypothetical protein